MKESRKISIKMKRKIYYELPFWLTWKSFGWYVGFLVVLLLISGSYLTGAYVCVERGIWTEKQLNIAYLVFSIIILISFIYPAVWTYKRRKYKKDWGKWKDIKK